MKKWLSSAGHHGQQPLPLCVIEVKQWLLHVHVNDGIKFVNKPETCFLKHFTLFRLLLLIYHQNNRTSRKYKLYETSNHHSILSPLFDKRHPDFSVDNFDRTFKQSLMLSSGDKVASGPPIPVLTQPGCNAATRIPLFFSSSWRLLVTIFIAAWNSQYKAKLHEKVSHF